MQAHVWITTTDQMPPTSGLLFEWRKTPMGQWEGRVVMLTGTVHEPGEAIAIRWIPADRLRPVSR